MTQYNIGVSDTTSITVNNSNTSSIVDLILNVLNSLDIPVVYISEVKSVDVQRWGIVGVLEMQAVEPVITGNKTYNNYTFVLHYYNDGIYPSALNDEDVKSQVMGKIIGANIQYGGVVVGFTINIDYSPATMMRGAWKINYVLKAWVSY